MPATFAGRVRTACAPVRGSEFEWFVFRGEPDLTVAKNFVDRHRCRAPYLDWVVGAILERAPMPRFFEQSAMARAVVEAEDRRFWSHPGIDAKAMARATVATVRGCRQGASTLVQQLVRHILGWYEPHPRRKAVEVALALSLAARWDRRALLWASILVGYVGDVAPQGTLGLLRSRFLQIDLMGSRPCRVTRVSNSPERRPGSKSSTCATRRVASGPPAPAPVWESWRAAHAAARRGSIGCCAVSGVHSAGKVDLANVSANW
ncbi:MAG: transglycosylase domain-containing protein [Sandaracinus sp.]|nr:transglycosylase domain-containing protein [Sandaracinus sp.]